jgi:hypothetical protein
MNRSLVRAAACTLAAAALTLAFLAVPASSPLQAATLTLSDPNCDSFTLSGTAPNQTLTCVVSSPPTCTVSGPTTGTLGSPITLTANCTPAAKNWAWTSTASGGGCGGAANQSCQDTQNVGGTVTYKVTGSNDNGTGPQSLGSAVVWSNIVAAPSGCSITGLPSGTQTSPYSYNLGVSCGGGAPTAWQWSVGSTATTSQIIGSISATTTFKVIASNSGGAAPQVSATISVGSGGGGGGPISCSGFAATRVIDIKFGNSIQAYTANYGGFGSNEALVVTFTTSTVTTSTSTGYIQAVEYVDPITARTGTLSDQPCDFSNGLPKVGGGNAAFINDVGPWSSFTLGTTKNGYPTLLPGKQYFFNISNASCPSGSCNMVITMHKPFGT